MSYSQNQEDLFILNYFGDYKGTVLEIGANDGIMLSNSRLAIQNGWSAYLVEPGETFNSLKFIYGGNPNIKLFPYGIGEKTEQVNFYASKSHIPNGSDIGLVSSISYKETERWRNAGVEFITTTIQIRKYSEWYETQDRPKFDFISLDCEGGEWGILQLIDLDECACKCLCIEWNGNPDLRNLFNDYCSSFGMVLMVQNNENLIFCR